jgi:hypothetical protein
MLVSNGVSGPAKGRCQEQCKRDGGRPPARWTQALYQEWLHGFFAVRPAFPEPRAPAKERRLDLFLGLCPCSYNGRFSEKICRRSSPARVSTLKDRFCKTIGLVKSGQPCLPGPHFCGFNVLTGTLAKSTLAPASVGSTAGNRPLARQLCLIKLVGGRRSPATTPGLGRQS